MKYNQKKVKLKDGYVAELIMGVSPNSKFYNNSGSGVPFLQGSAQFGELTPVTNIYTSEIVKVAEEGDILISVRAPVGDLNIADKKYCIGRGLAAIRAREKIDSKFLFYFLLINKNKIQSESSGSTFKSINKNVLENFEILLPTKPTQQKIVKILDNIQVEIDNQRQVIEKTKELKKSLMKKMFSEGVHNEKLKVTEVGKMPESWEVIKIGDLGTIITGNTPSTEKKQFYGGKYKLISPADLNDERYIKTAHKLITEEGLNTCRILPKDSILVSCIGEIGKIGMTVDEKSASNQQINAVVCGNQFDPNFVYYLLSYRKQDFQKYAAKVTIPIINKNNFSKILIPFCRNIKEQKEISSILQKVDEQIELRQKQKKLYEELFNITLNKLMTGGVDIKK